MRLSRCALRSSNDAHVVVKLREVYNSVTTQISVSKPLGLAEPVALIERNGAACACSSWRGMV
jgi:hypothetical protein